MTPTTSLQDVALPTQALICIASLACGILVVLDSCKLPTCSCLCRIRHGCWRWLMHRGMLQLQL